LEDGTVGVVNVEIHMRWKIAGIEAVLDSRSWRPMNRRADSKLGIERGHLEGGRQKSRALIILQKSTINSPPKNIQQKKIELIFQLFR
jgi:hypothetical protein